MAEGIRDKFASVKNNLPNTIDADVLYDSTLAITDSIDEVVKTIAEAAIIVIVVILLFLGSFRAS